MANRAHVKLQYRHYLQPLMKLTYLGTKTSINLHSMSHHDKVKTVLKDFTKKKKINTLVWGSETGVSIRGRIQKHSCCTEGSTEHSGLHH